MARWRLENRFDAEIEQARRHFQLVPAPIVKAVIATESGFDPDAYLEEAGGDGSVGLMQIRPSTARVVGYHGTKVNLFLPSVNIYYGTAYLAKLAGQLRVAETGRWADVFSAYNGGIRPHLGFSAPVTKVTLVCLRKDPISGRCVRTFTAQPGQYGNQEHVDRALSELSYFGGGKEAQRGAGGGAGLVLAALVIGGLGYLTLKG